MTTYPPALEPGSRIGRAGGRYLVAAAAGIAGLAAALQPLSGVAGAIVILVVGCYAVDKRAALILLFIWLLVQNSVISILDTHGLRDSTVWLRRSDEVILSLLAICTILDQLIRHGRVTLYGTGAPVAAILLIAVASAMGAGHAPMFVSALDLVLLLKGATVFLLVAHGVNDPRVVNTRGIILLVIATGGLALAAAVLEIIDVSGFRDFVGLPTLLFFRAGWNSLQGPFVHPGVFGWYMAVCVLACVALGVSGDRRGWWWMFPFVLGILASGRRKPLGGAIAAVLVLVWLSSPKKLRWRRVLWGVLGTAGLLALFWPFVSDVAGAAIHDYLLTRNPLSQARNALYFASGVLALRHFPLGAGPGLFGGFASRLYYSPLYAQLGLNHVWGLSPDNPIFLNDTFWPHVLGEFGILGVCAYCWLLAAMFRGALKASRLGSPAVRLAASLGIALAVEGLVESIAGPGFEESLNALVMFGGLALATGAGAMASADRQFQRSSQSLDT